MASVNQKLADAFDKLATVARGATANAPDAQLRDRSTHTGSQAIGTVTGLQAALDAKADATASTTTAASTKAANYTLALADAGTVVEMNMAGANTVTVPPDSAVAFPVGTILDVCQTGTGATTIAAGTGVTLRTAGALTLRTQWSSVTLRKRAANEWVLAGDTV